MVARGVWGGLEDKGRTGTNELIGRGILGEASHSEPRL